MLNKQFIQRKIKLIQEDLAHLEPFARYRFDEIAEDPIKYAATERFLERIVTRAIDINHHCLARLGEGNEVVRDYQDTFKGLADLGVYPKEFGTMIAPSAGLRNILVHEYDEVDAKQVYRSVSQALTQYAKYCDYLLKFIKRK